MRCGSRIWLSPDSGLSLISLSSFWFYVLCCLWYQEYNIQIAGVPIRCLRSLQSVLFKSSRFDLYFCLSSVFFIKLFLFSPGVDNSCRCIFGGVRSSASQVRQVYLLWLPRCSALLWGRFLYCFLAFGKKRQPVVWCFLRVFLPLRSPLVCDRARDAP